MFEGIRTETLLGLLKASRSGIKEEAKAIELLVEEEWFIKQQEKEVYELEREWVCHN